MITPLNGHVLIEPVAQDSFIASSKETFEEIGTVVAISQSASDEAMEKDGWCIEVGERVYFDAWLAAKYPKGKDGFYWLVKWEDIRASEEMQDQVTDAELDAALAETTSDHVYAQPQ